jgi:shikimate kinase
MKRNIVIIGFRGVGKTTITEALSKAMGWSHFEVDEEIRRRLGSIIESVKRDGWKPFHDMESEIIDNLRVEETVIGCGGGVLQREENAGRLKSLGIVVFLNASAQTIARRLEGSHQRPAIGNAPSIKEEVEGILPLRLPAYRRAADMEIDTEGKTVSEIVSQIIERLKTFGLRPK